MDMTEMFDRWEKDKERIAEQEQQLAELQAKVAEYEYPLRTKETVTVPIEVWDAREQQLTELREALHEIYRKACQAMREDDDIYLWQFAQDARDIALKASLKQGGEG